MMENHIKREGDTKYYYVFLCPSTTHFPQTPSSLPYGVLFPSPIHTFKSKDNNKIPLLCKCFVCILNLKDWTFLNFFIWAWVFLEFLGILFGGYWLWRNNMKRDSVSFDQSHVADDEANAKVKYQSLLKEYLELQKVFVSKKRKLQAAKQKRETILAEVRYDLSLHNLNKLTNYFSR
ncbi:hypothetical protein CDL12_15495 [Handroanthus impetiginosus]|uniref:Uncharacterized protein n=1 Tax=Handroanthus impetiginosus TaxID=429701 RepID=A0A2G9H338_9LAMI|nr:hypothetical protein CDL12_15495 [Handroanthus impetiginosus]